MENVKSQKMILPHREAGKRADAVISGILPQSRSQVAALIRSGGIHMNGKKFKPSAIVEGGETVEFKAPEDSNDFIEPESIPVEVIFEDDDIVVVNKPAGMTVHPGAGRKNSTLANALAHRCANLSTAGGRQRPGIVHRLDKDTSGVLVAAKNNLCHAALAEQFAERSVEKRYVALVCGAVKKNEGVFSSPIGRSPANRKKMSGTAPVKPRPSETFWETVERFRDWSFVRIRPKTGRTHQIRVHFSEAGHPVAADPVYAGKTAKSLLASAGLSNILSRQALHSQSITLRHPASGKKTTFSAPIPADMAEALAFLRKQTGGLQKTPAFR